MVWTQLALREVILDRIRPCHELLVGGFGSSYGSSVSQGDATVAEVVRSGESVHDTPKVAKRGEGHPHVWRQRERKDVLVILVAWYRKIRWVFGYQLVCVG